MIENEQREGLKPLELALFVQKRMALGARQADIARNLGKSRQWVSVATALIDAPEWLLQAYRAGRCRGRNELYELRRLHEEHAAEVQTWAATEPSITRDRIGALRATLERGARPAEVELKDAAPVSPTPGIDCAPSPDAGIGSSAGPAAARPVRARPVDTRIHVEFEGQRYLLVVSVAPDRPEHMYVRPLAGGPDRLAPTLELKLLGFVGG